MNHNSTPRTSANAMVSIQEVARIAGVSIATVSRTINNKGRVKEEMRERVERAIASTGFAPNTLAQNFRRGRTRSILVVLPSLGNLFLERVAKGIQSLARETAYEVLFTASDSTRSISALLSRQVDGLILLANVPSAGTDILARQSHRTLPIVVAYDAIQPQTAHLPSIRIDDLSAAQEATRFLIEQGHERIAFIGDGDESLLMKDREAGYRCAMNVAQLSVKRDWVQAAPRSTLGIIRATRSLLLSTALPTSIVCGSDEIAIAAMHELRSAGLHVPEDVSVIGFDDIRYSELTNPPLTTIKQPAEDIGKRAMSRIIDVIEGRIDRVPEPELVEHQLVVRQSVARLNAHSRSEARQRTSRVAEYSLDPTLA